MMMGWMRGRWRSLMVVMAMMMTMMMQMLSQFGILHHLMCLVGVWVLCYKHGTSVE